MKFKVGDKVKVIIGGWGCSPNNDIGKIVTIIKTGSYNNKNGYRVSPAIGNTRTGLYEGFIGEESFELVDDTMMKLKEKLLK